MAQGGRGSSWSRLKKATSKATTSTSTPLRRAPIASSVSATPSAEFSRTAVGRTADERIQGNGLGASDQTGWTGLVIAWVIHVLGYLRSDDLLASDTGGNLVYAANAPKAEDWPSP